MSVRRSDAAPAFVVAGDDGHVCAPLPPPGQVLPAPDECEVGGEGACPRRGILRGGRGSSEFGRDPKPASRAGVRLVRAREPRDRARSHFVFRRVIRFLPPASRRRLGSSSRRARDRFARRAPERQAARSRVPDPNRRHDRGYGTPRRVKGSGARELLGPPYELPIVRAGVVRSPDSSMLRRSHSASSGNPGGRGMK